jgi:SagB-type dehydrogenase family enzyme
MGMSGVIHGTNELHAMELPDTCPRILREIVAVPIEDGVLIDGLGRQPVIRGPFAQTVLPDLLRLMDGSRTVHEIAGELLSIPFAHVRNAISLLKGWGLIEHMRDRQIDLRANGETAAFLKRHIATAGLADSARDACTSLANSTVIIIGEKDRNGHVNLLQQLLETSGIGSVRSCSKDRFLTSDSPPNALVISQETEGENEEWHKALDYRRRESSYSWLRVSFSTRMKYVDIGPVFTSGNETCFSCFHEVHKAVHEEVLVAQTTIFDQAMLTSFIALETLYTLALPDLALTGRMFRRLRLPEWEARLLCYPTLPSCQCRQDKSASSARLSRGTDNPRSPLTSTALVYEEYIGIENRSGRRVVADDDMTEIGRTVASQAKRLENCQQIPLCRGNRELHMDIFEAMRKQKRLKVDSVTLDKLATILALTSGIRELSERTVQRWAPNAGNLGSVELFIVNRTIDDLPSGFYFYQPQEHSLALFRKRGAMDVNEFMRGVLGDCHDDLPDALVLFTGAFHRLSRKYGSFSYKLIHLDAGSSLSQLNIVARSVGVCARLMLSEADDLIGTQLNLLQFDEIPTAVVALSNLSSRNSFRNRLFADRTSTPPAQCAWKAAAEFDSSDLQQVTEMLINEQRTAERGTRSGKWIVPKNILARVGQSSSIVKLPFPVRGGATVGSAFSKRISVRQYSPDPIRALDIGTALHYAYSADMLDWPAENGAYLPLTFVILAKNVLGVQEGVYEYQPDRHGLESMGRCLSHAQSSELFIQGEFANAPAVIWVIGNLAGACARDGVSGYRRDLIRAGAAGHRLWMAAIGLGLSGCLVAGMVPSAGRRLLGLDGYKRAAYIAFATGYARGTHVSNTSAQSS